MSIQTIPLATLQKVRAHIQPALKLDLPSTAVEPPPPDSIAALSDLFDRSFDSAPVRGWRLSAIDPGAILNQLPGLKLHPRYRLVGYLWQDDRGTQGRIWAVPIERATTMELERAILPTTAPPCPVAALPNWMQAIAGDRSPGSFLIAALLRRELQDWGTTGAYCNWSYHRLIDRVPTPLRSIVSHDRLQNLSPRLRLMPDRRVAVEFFTCRVTSPIQIFRHVDVFSATNYTASSLDREVLL